MSRLVTAEAFARPLLMSLLLILPLIVRSVIDDASSPSSVARVPGVVTSMVFAIVCALVARASTAANRSNNFFISCFCLLRNKLLLCVS